MSRSLGLCPCGRTGRLVRGQCHTCYSRWWRKQPPTPAIPAADRFDAKVQERQDGCWIWTGSHVPKGYGQFAPQGSRQVYAHRWAWERVNGPIPEGLVIDHLCRVPSCVNPAHLEAVTPLENNRRAFRQDPCPHCDRPIVPSGMRAHLRARHEVAA